MRRRPVYWPSPSSSPSAVQVHTPINPTAGAAKCYLHRRTNLWGFLRSKPPTSTTSSIRPALAGDPCPIHQIRRAPSFPIALNAPLEPRIPALELLRSWMLQCKGVFYLVWNAVDSFLWPNPPNLHPVVLSGSGVLTVPIDTEIEGLDELWDSDESSKYPFLPTYLDFSQQMIPENFDPCAFGLGCGIDMVH
ncbi:hypothetical protein HU200_040775 [Digitaria exilis]|uniref:Uncharacterized protein n=1 Tax=Digitaria exilis TaxID=1010633 RepID=A0A835EFT3_9POAL|nr:hypothetical protein HU200_040775 [Digitaria exilis]